jgi:hypothetical protein
MLVPDNPFFVPSPSEVTRNDCDNAKAVIFMRRNAFSYVRPPYSSSCSPSSRASSKSCLRTRREQKITSLPLIDVDYIMLAPHLWVGKRCPRGRNHSGLRPGAPPLWDGAAWRLWVTDGPKGEGKTFFTLRFSAEM